MVGFSKIFTQAYEITIKNKFLWIFGLFLGLANAFAWQDMSQKPVNMPIWLILIGIVIYLIIYFRSKTGLIGAVKTIKDNQEISFKKSLKDTKYLSFSVFIVYLVSEIVIGLVAGLISIPIISLFEKGNLMVATTFLVFGLLIFIPIAVIGSLVGIMAPMFVVIYNLKPRDAVRGALDLISKRWMILVSLAFLIFIPQFLLILLSYPVVFLADLPYHMVGLVFTIAAILILILLNSWVAVFQQAVWVLAFLDLIKPQKIEEDSVVVAPEIAGG